MADEIPALTDREQPGMQYWRQNLWVCLFGSFTTLCAMTLLLPFLPIYVAHLGVTSQAAVVQWSGVAFSATFLAAALVAPLWGRLADRYGRKLTLMRASLGMAVAMSLIGLAQDVYQLVLFRLLAGLVGGYSSGAVILVATQTPKERSGWALGTLSTGALAGSLVGPLIGGVLPDLIGIRETFFLAGGVIFVAFLATCLLIREAPATAGGARARLGRGESAWALIPDRAPVLALLSTALLLMFANMSIEPVITVYMGQLIHGGDRVVLMSGLAMSAAAFGSILAAPLVGRLADRVGPRSVIVGGLAAAGLLLVPQAFVNGAWQLVGLRFLMGIALGGLMPAITSLIRHSVPDKVAGTVLGYTQSALYAGQVTGPLAGGFVGGHLGVPAVFGASSLLLLAGAAWNRSFARPKAGAQAAGDTPPIEAGDQ